MAMDELEALLAEGDKTPTPASEETQENKKDEEVLKKEQQLANLQKAIAEANTQLKDLRKPKTQAQEDEEIPKIDMDDPSSKAWNKHINSQVNPLQEELEKEMAAFMDQEV